MLSTVLVLVLLSLYLLKHWEINQLQIHRTHQIFNQYMDTHNQRIAKMTFSSVYPLYIAKVEKKGRTKAELHQVIEWLTGFDSNKLQEMIRGNVTFETFFQNYHRINIWVSCGGNRGSFDSTG
jgi:hypothetical protein